MRVDSKRNGMSPRCYDDSPQRIGILGRTRTGSNPFRSGANRTNPRGSPPVDVLMER